MQDNPTRRAPLVVRALTTLAIAAVAVLVAGVTLFLQGELAEPHHSKQDLLRDLTVMLPANLISYWAIVSVIVFAYHRMLPFFESLPEKRRRRKQQPERGA
jgi:Zn-dependent protease with chaperone function